jgi:hypothetical protein
MFNCGDNLTVFSKRRHGPDGAQVRGTQESIRDYFRELIYMAKGLMLCLSKDYTVRRDSGRRAGRARHGNSQRSGHGPPYECKPIIETGR